MSVHKSDRNESTVQFLETARNLEIFSLKSCANFPKRYTFLITSEIAQLARSIYNNVKSANSIFPINQHEAQIRRDYFNKANCELQCLSSQLNVAKILFDEAIKTTIWCQWMDLIDEEAKLISVIKKTDRERYKNLPL